MDLGVEVKAFKEARYRCSSLGCRVRVDLIGRNYELEISEILLMVDLGNGLSQYSIIAFMCTVTLCRVGRGCTVVIIHHSWRVWVEFVFETTSNGDS